MTMLPTSRDLDDRMVRAMPAEEVHRLDGWELRATSTSPFRRLNSTRTVGPVTDVDAAIAAVESFYSQRNLPVRFQLSPAAEPSDLDGRLEERGYIIEAPVIVATATTATVAASPSRDEPPHVVLGGAHETWIEQCTTVWRDDRDAQERVLAYGRLLRGVATSPGTIVATALAREPNLGWAGVGFAVGEGDHAGIFGMGTHPASRRHGMATAVLRALAVWAERSGARHLYLQVEEDNDAARALYARAGFVDRYGYHYRTKQ